MNITARATVRVSVIIPTLNDALNIGRAAEHAPAPGPHKILAADGGSQDETRELAQSAGVALLDRPRGRAVQQIAAARRTTGDVLFILHADCRLAAEWRGKIAGPL